MSVNELSYILLLLVNCLHLMPDHRQKSSGAEGDRLKEATNINKSLSTLGFVNIVSLFFCLITTLQF